jgi:leader peptidase (prepilin peptidase)/N-methyltransferase
MLAALSALLGIAVGALAPRVAYRLSVDYGTPPRAGCVACGRPFPAGLPGWVRVSARCPGCRVRHGLPVWLGMLVGGVSFGVLAWAIGAVAWLPPYLVAAGIGVVLAAVDVASLRLPDLLVGAIGAVAVGWLAAVSLVDGQWGDLGRAALGAGVSALCYLVLALLPGSHLGFGDVKLAGVLGLLLGWLGWLPVFAGLLLPHLVNGPVALGLLVTGRAGRRSDLPLGPALLAGALLAVVTHKVTQSAI